MRIISLLLLCLSLLPNKLFAHTTPTNVLANINAYRTSHGLPPLQLNTEISQLAKAHSVLMAEHKIEFGHGGFSERSKQLFAYFPHTRSMAENVAYADLDEVKPIIQSWLNSSGHRRNIMGNYNLTGIGVAKDTHGRVYVTQIFLRARD